MAATIVFSTLGTTVAISAGVPATYDAAGYAALTYTTIGEIKDAGQFGLKINKITHTPIDTGVVTKRKGSKDYGTMTLKVGRLTTNAGQALCITALASASAEYAFKVTLQDGSIQYWSGQVFSFDTELGSVDSIVSASIMIELTRPTIEV